MTDRYRGFAGQDSGTTLASYLNIADGGSVPETIDWSQSRYLDYALLSVDVVPGGPGTDSTMTVKAINDTGQEIDSVTLLRRVHDSAAAHKQTARGSSDRTPHQPIPPRLTRNNTNHLSRHAEADPRSRTDVGAAADRSGRAVLARGDRCWDRCFVARGNGCGCGFVGPSCSPSGQLWSIWSLGGGIQTGCSF